MSEADFAAALIATWAAFSIACGFLAHLKNRGVFTLALAGFLFGPLALIYAIFMRAWPPQSDSAKDPPSVGWYDHPAAPGMEQFWSGQQWGPTRPKP